MMGSLAVSSWARKRGGARILLKRGIKGTGLNNFFHFSDKQIIILDFVVSENKRSLLYMNAKIKVGEK